MVSWCPFPLVGAEVTGGCFRSLNYHLFSRCLQSGVVRAGPKFLYNISGMRGQEITSGRRGTQRAGPVQFAVPGSASSLSLPSPTTQANSHPLGHNPGTQASLFVHKKSKGLHPKGVPGLSSFS